MSRGGGQDAEERLPVLRPETGRDGYEFVHADRGTGPSHDTIGEYPARTVAEPTGGTQASGVGG